MSPDCANGECAKANEVLLRPNADLVAPLYLSPP